MVAAACMVATIFVTSRTWTARTTPPNLPAFGWVPDIDWRPVLVVLALAVIVVPRLAGLPFVIAVAAALLADQTRIQPEIVSLTILMVAPAFGRQGVALARYHLAAMWLWAGLHKVLSVKWTSSAAAFIAGLMHQPHARPVVAVLLPCVEIGLGVAAIVRRAWPTVAWLALLFHALVLSALLYGNWNEAVWAWNVALGIAGFLLFRDRSPVTTRQDWATIAIGVVVLASPTLFYAGILDGYLAHNLYTDNSATAAVCTGAGCNYDPFDTWHALKVPLPAEPRLFRQSFRRTCKPGSVLGIVGRATVFTDPPHHTLVTC